jgi:predicted Zn finger-like uncharacterized protein
MTVSCPDCRSVFRVDPAKVPATGVRARCSVCGGIILVGSGTGPLRTPARTPVTSIAAAPYAPRPATPSAGSVALAPPFGAVTPRTATPSAVPGMASRPTPVGTPTPASPSGGFRTAGAPTPTAAAPTPSTPAPFSATAPTPVITRSAPATPGAATPVRSTGAATPVASSATATPGASSGAATPITSSGAATPVASTGLGGATAPRRPVNPFLNADPGQRARRLARALVSDLVAYHPRKREEGLAQGTLRQLFREDIKKSYEEYVEQVGRELAESTPHFQEALNDILAGGQRLF